MKTGQLQLLLKASWQIAFASFRLVLKAIWLVGQFIWVGIFTVPVVVIFADSSSSPELRWGALVYIGLIVSGAVIGLGLRYLIKRKLLARSSRPEQTTTN